MEGEQYYGEGGEYAVEGEYGEGEYGDYQQGYYGDYEGQEVPQEGVAPQDDNYDNGVTHGTKRSAEDDGPDAKRAMVETPAKNPVAELNERLPGLEYKCLDTGAGVTSPVFTMQITVAGQVFEAQAGSKKKAKQICASAALQYLNDNNVNDAELSVRKASKNPTTILNEIRPHSKYEFIEETSEEGLRYYRMKLRVGDDEFIAKGRSKHLAKSYAAMEALQKLFNLQFNVPDFEQMPTFEGDESEWKKHKKVKEVILFEERNPISEMHSLYRPLPYEMTDLGNCAGVPRFKCKIDIEGTTFLGEGRSRQVAKTHACFDALTYLKEHGLLEPKRAEAAAAREARLAEIKAEQEAAAAAEAAGQPAEQQS